MRVLFTAVPSAGHVNPLLPLARALIGAGHDVTLASGDAAAPAARRAGLSFVRAGLEERELVAEAANRFRGVAPTGRGISMFASIAAPALVDDLLPQLDRLAPELIVSEEGEWGGPVLAAATGVRGAAHGWGAPLWSDDELAAVDAQTRPLWRRHGVEPGSPAGLFDSRYLDACPPLLQDGRATRIAVRRAIRFEPFDSGEAAPSWLAERETRPLVYVTLGTVPTFNTAANLLAAIARGVGDLDVDTVMTLGRNNDPASLEPLPPNVRAERHLSQVAVLRRSSAVITHGGAGSTLAALSFGLPLLILPRGAPSQERLAQRCAEAGAALVLREGEATSGAVRDTVAALLEDSRYRAAAGQVRDSIDAAPAVEALVSDLTRESAR